MKRKENAYFTVEAAMLLPLVILIIIFLIYLIFFQYNRCLTEQDMGALALKGCTIQEADKEELMKKLNHCAEQINKEKYVIWRTDAAKVKLQGGNILVEQTGRLYFPFGGLRGNGGEYWKATVSYENKRMNPVDYLRTYRKLTGGK